MSDADALRLMALVCSRLCHDLVGPAGAIANGLELLDEPASRDQALALTRTTSGQLNRRLAFYRRAWGTGHGLTWDEAYEVAAGLLQGSRHELDWQSGEGGEAPSVRLALNMLLCLMDATPLGARLTVMPGERPEVEAEGELRRAEVLQEAVADPLAAVDGIAPRDAQPYLTARLAAAAGLRLALQREDDERLSLTLERW